MVPDGEDNEEDRLGRLVSQRPEAVGVRIRLAEAVAVRDPVEAVTILCEGALFAATAADLSALAAVLAGFDAQPDAIRLYQRAARLAPYDVEPLVGQALAWGRLGEKAKAEAAAARAIALGWQAPFPLFEDRPTSTSIRHLFDQYAARFDEHLTHTLRYDVPRRLATLIDAIAPPDDAFPDVIDVGCGTGLMGEFLRPRSLRLTGLDLSRAMLGEAGKKHVYDTLLEGDAENHLLHCKSQFDLVAAADVLVYVARMPPFMSAVAQGLRPGGLFAGSIETHGGEGTILLASRRYAHSPADLQTAARAAGLSMVVHEAVSPRLDAGSQVPGLNFVLRKSAATAPSS